MKIIISSIRILAVLTLLTGFLYPLLLTPVAQLVFPRGANGSLVVQEGKIIGSELLAQKTESPRYFWPRPSAGDYATVASGASNLGPTTETLKVAVAERRTKFGQVAPADMLTTSGSGLDPHVSPDAARHQATRIAVARAIPMETVIKLLEDHVENRQFGLFGEPRVNVLMLNLALDGQK